MCVALYKFVYNFRWFVYRILIWHVLKRYHIYGADSFYVEVESLDVLTCTYKRHSTSKMVSINSISINKNYCFVYRQTCCVQADPLSRAVSLVA